MMDSGSHYFTSKPAADRGLAAKKVRVQQDILAVDPLGDKAFKKLLEDTAWFKMIAEAVLQRSLPDGNIISIQGERALSVNGKLIRMDNFRKTEEGVVNIEAQREAREFPFKRHLFYWAIAYSTMLEEGHDYKELQPAISIVLYKSKRTIRVIESASLQGDLVRNDDDKALLNLIAVNTALWRDSPTTELHQILAILHNGICNERTESEFDDIDTKAPLFQAFNRAVRNSSMRVMYEEYKEGGKSDMVDIVKGFLTDEEREVAERKGECKSAVRIYYTEMKLTPKQIAAKLCITEHQVIDFIKELGLQQ